MRRHQRDVALRGILSGQGDQRADAGAGDQPLQVDVAEAVVVADVADHRVRGIGLRARAGADVAIGAEQVDVAALLRHDAALVEQDRAVGEGADRAAAQREDALLAGLEHVARRMADGDAAPGSDDVDVSAQLRLEHRRRDVELAGRHQHCGAIASAPCIIGVTRAGREQGRDHGIGTSILIVVRARRVLRITADLGDEIEEDAVDQELLPRLRQALEGGPGLVSRLAEDRSDIRKEIDAADTGPRGINVLCDRGRIVDPGLGAEHQVDLGPVRRQIRLHARGEERRPQCAAIAHCRDALRRSLLGQVGWRERPHVVPGLKNESAGAVKKIGAADQIVTGVDAGDVGWVVVLADEVEISGRRAVAGR